MNMVSNYQVKVFLDGDRKPFSVYETLMVGLPTQQEGLMPWKKVLRKLGKTAYLNRVSKVKILKIRKE